MTPSQQGLVLHALGAEQPGVGVEHCLVRVSEALDVVAWRQAWQQAVAQLPVLRSHFEWRDGAATRLSFADNLAVDITLHDLRGQSQDATDAAVLAHRQSVIALDQPPVFRLAVLQTGDSQWIALWSYHLAVLDAPSAQRVLAWVLAVYQGRATPSAPSEALPLPAIDAASEAWWSDYLRGFEGPTPLPWSQADGSGFGQVAVTLGTADCAALIDHAHAAGLPWGSLVETAWAVLLWRHVESDEVVFGVVQSGRAALPEAARQGLGVCIDTVPRRFAVAPDATVAQCATDLAQARQAAQPHQSIGLAAVQHQCASAGQALCTSLVQIEEASWNAVLADALPSTSWTVEHDGVTGFPLSVRVVGGQQWRLTLEYDRAEVSESTAQELLARLQTILSGMAELGLQTRLRDLPWLTDEDRARVTKTWNQTEASSPFESVPAALRRHVRQAPDATAIVFAGQSTSYAALAGRVNALAAAMRQAGVAHGDRVAVCLQRGVDLIAGLIAVQQLGAAYVPCDPNYPQQRLQVMLDDADVSLIVTSADSRAHLPAGTASTLLIDEVPPSYAPEPLADLPANLPAYVIFTSGSTGRPKGVVVSHGNLSNLLQSMAQRPGFAAGQRMLAVTTVSFDIAGLEFFLPLTVGGAVVLASQHAALDGPALIALLRDTAVDAMQATPVTYRLLLGAGWQPPAGFKALIGGEALDAQLAQRLLEAGDDGFELWNMYGPTETTIWSTCARVTPGPVHIGTPIANTQCYVVDAQDRLVAPGASGELLIGGAGAAQGYFRRDDLTAERFVPNPFGDGLVYRTGDRARWEPQADGSGQLACLGRLDFQVKLRGFRIELGEIEARLAAHAGIDLAVVVLRKEGGDRLVAYLTGADIPPASALHAWLGETLPAYMIPAQFVTLDTMPLTLNGKIDRKALPAPAQDADTGRQQVRPRNELEASIATAWGEVLGIAQVGVNDSFFELGGDSLRLVAVLDRLPHDVQARVKVPDLFRHTTVAKLAAFVSAAATPTGQTKTADKAVDQRAAQRRAAAGAAARARRGQR